MPAPSGLDTPTSHCELAPHGGSLRGMTDTGVDIGTLLEVPEGQRLDVDDVRLDEMNEDEYADLSSVPDGQVVVLTGEETS